MELNESIEFEKKLWQEQFNAMERSYKMEERKNTFIIALFGFGSFSFWPNAPKDLIYLYNFIPLFAIALDSSILSQKYSVRRIGRFLGLNSRFQMERDWEKFVDKHRESKIQVGTEVFNFLSFIASLWMICKYQCNGQVRDIPVPVYIWFSILVVFELYSKSRIHRRISKLPKIPTYQSIPIP